MPAAPGRGRQPTVVLATRNPGKLRELRRILAATGPPVHLVGLDALPGAPEVVETGASFAENALLKARSAAAHSGWPALADDSGLAVDALAGMPGIFSARWAGRHGDDAANLRLLLDQIADVPEGRRGAAFVCAAALVAPDGTEVVTEGVLRGRLAHRPRGEHGFGYDPVFCPEGMECTTAELAGEDKDAISHRGRAFAALAPHLAAWLSSAAAR